MSSPQLTMTEHPAWRPLDGQHTRVFPMPGGEQWAVSTLGAQLTVTPLDGAKTLPQADEFALDAGSPGGAAELLAALGGITPVRRFRNPSLWDAIGTAIVRQVIRAPQATKLYRLFCDTYGEKVALPSGHTYALFPTPTRTLSLSDDDFVHVGMAFKRRPLRQAAEAYWEHHKVWESLTPAELVATLPKVKGIGVWTAGAAVADYWNDWALYPYADLAVRTWANRAAPSMTWPSTETEFSNTWRGLCGPHLSVMTLLTLAWGNHHAGTS